MVCYLLDPENPTKSCKSRGSNLHVHFKKTPETAQAIRGVRVCKATKYLKDVTLPKECVPFHCYNGGIGRCAQAKQWGWTQGRSPTKSAEFLLFMLKNAKNLKVYMSSLWSLSTFRWTKLPRCGAELTEPMGGLARTRALPATERWPLLWKSRWLLSQKRSLYGRKRYSRRNWRNKNL